MGDVIPQQVFHELKVLQYINHWQYGKTTTEQFKKNLMRMGYDKETIEGYLEDT